LAQAMKRRGNSGVPLPDVFPALAARGVKIRRGELTMVIGPPSAGKSLIMFNLLARLGLPSLAFLLDTTELGAATRFASILTGDVFATAKQRIMEGDDSYHQIITDRLPDLHACFYAPTLDDTMTQLAAFDQRYGAPPDVMVLDNMGNQTSAMGDEWALLKALALELDQMARQEQVAIVAAHHTTDITDMEPAARDKALGKISQYARLMLSVNYNPDTFEYKVAVVKNSEGVSDLSAKHPITMWADPSRMAITDNQQVAYSWRNINHQVNYTEPRPVAPVVTGGFGGYRDAA
jgi:hypothetical protein